MGINDDHGPYPESAVKRCRRCHYTFNGVRFPRAKEGSRQGSGVSLVTQSATIVDPQVSRGCPFCGTLLH